jgi:excisionase family DNA binding protein
MANPKTREDLRGDITPLFYSVAEAGLILRSGKTRIYELIHAGELDAVKDGRSNKITAVSVHRRAQKLIDNAAKVSHTADLPAA